MKVLHVIPSLSPREGGPSFALPAIARALLGCGVEVTIASTDDDGPGRRFESEPRPQVEGARCFYFRKDTQFYKYSRSLGAWLRECVAEFDIVHVHALFSYASIAAARAAWSARVPYVIRPLGVLNRWGMQNRRRVLKRLSMRWVDGPVLDRAAAIHFTSRREKQEAEQAHASLNPGKSAVIPLPVIAPAPVSSDLFLSTYPDAAGRRIVLFLSRVDRKKGVELLMEAFARQQDRDAILVIAGEGESAYESSLQDLAERLGIAARVLWPGFLRGEEKISALTAASVFVLPSYSENFGIAAAEALSLGVPSILSEGVALTEYTADAAIVVSPRAEAIAEALDRVLNNAAFRDHLARRGPEVVHERLSLEVVGAALRRLYESISEHQPVAR